MGDDETLTLGERQLAGVLNLWQQVNSQGKILDHHGQDIEALRKELAALKGQVHGLKVSRGKMLAHNARLQKAITDSESGLKRIDAALH